MRLILRDFTPSIPSIFMGATGTMMLQSLFTTAVGRVVPVLYQKMVRRSKVEAALRGTTPANRAVNAALADYEVIVGSHYGELTEMLDRFLRQIESSGIVVAMAEEAAIHQRTELTRTAFLALHRDVFGETTGNAETLYDHIAVSFETSLELLIADPALALLFRSIAGDLIKRLERIEEQTMSISIQMKPLNDDCDVAASLQKINKALAAQYRDIRVETNRGAKLVSIDRIFIPSKLRGRKEPEMFKEIISLEMAPRKSRERHRLDQRDTTMISYNEFRGGFRRAVILGDPGGGKSTLCQYLCHQLARQYALVLQYPAKQASDFDAQLLKIPLRIVLRSFEGARIRNPQLGIFDFIVNELRATAALPLDELENVLQYTLNYGKAILAFDGLDEILSTGTRREFVDIVTSFCDQYPLCPVLVTSRVVGYEDAALPGDYEEFTLEKFDVKEIKQYVANFLRVFSGMKEGPASASAQQFINQTDRNASDLRQNPLMLGLMSFLFASKEDVPTNRPEIYRECAMLMFERWDQNRNIRADIPVGFDMLDLFGEIAATMYGDPELEEGVTGKWLTTRNREYFVKVYEDRAKIYEAAKKVTEFVTGRSWVMSEFGPKIYRFTHRTFMEFFFARNLEEQHETVEALLNALLPQIVNRQWDVISHLALQMKTFRSQKRTSQAAKLLQEFAKRERVDVARSTAIYAFFGNALNYMIPSEIECRIALLQILDGAFSIVALGDTEGAGSVILPITTCVAERREYIYRNLTEGLVQRLTAESPSAEFAFCTMILSGGDDEISLGHQFEMPAEIRTSVQASAKQALRRFAEVDPFAANIYVEWYRESIPELLAKHGIGMFFVDRRPWTKMSRQTAVFVVNLLFAASSHHSWGVKEPTIILESIGRWKEKLPSLTEIRTMANNRFFFPPEMWVHIVRRCKKNVYALRGTLILYRIMDDTLHETPVEDGGRKGVYPRSASVLAKPIDEAISALSAKEQELFGFWPPYGVWE